MLFGKKIHPVASPSAGAWVILAEKNMEPSLCRAYSATCVGLDVRIVTVEVSITMGIGVYIVGLPDSAVREALLRITTSLQHCGFRIPGRKTVINLAPANIRKEGSGYDAAIAVALLASSGQISCPDIDKCVIVGEISLDGRLRGVPGLLPIAFSAASNGFKYFICPAGSAGEVAYCTGIEVYGVHDLAEMAAVLSDIRAAGTFRFFPEKRSVAGYVAGDDDFSEVVGQEYAKRGLEIAASGGHNVMLCGPPGAGKSLMARCMASILPEMGENEAIETSMIYSVAGKSTGDGLMFRRPFRSPHHTASAVALIGGGNNMAPGEISLAHNGVLYLDEITQFSPKVLNALRQPLEERRISVSRARYKVSYPASFMLVASMNPCPCGYAGTDQGVCTCTPGMISRYRMKVSGPLTDRMDLNISVKAVEGKDLVAGRKGEPGSAIAARVAAARAVQAIRFRNERNNLNAEMTQEQIMRYCVIGREEKLFMDSIIDRFCISARGYSRIMKVARTIADMEGSSGISVEHISEAVHYRFQDFS